MEITTPEQAARNGQKTYYTGKPCKNGHVAPRYLGSGACKDCIKSNSRLQKISYIQRLQGDAPFTYVLHKADIAAAHAFCMALDMQRGRVPASSQASAPTPTRQPMQYSHPYALWARTYNADVAKTMADDYNKEKGLPIGSGYSVT